MKKGGRGKLIIQKRSQMMDGRNGTSCPHPKGMQVLASPDFRHKVFYGHTDWHS